MGNRELLKVEVKVALVEWRHWLEGAEHLFLMWTDHKNLQYVLTAKRLKPEKPGGPYIFTRFNFTLSYHPDSKNVKPDALSCQLDSD